MALKITDRNGTRWPSFQALAQDLMRQLDVTWIPVMVRFNYCPTCYHELRVVDVEVDPPTRPQRVIGKISVDKICPRCGVTQHTTSEDDGP